MTQYNALNNKTVEIKSVKNRTYRKNQDDSNLYVDSVILKTDDHEIPKNKITINPTVKEKKIERTKINGTEYENELESKRDPTIHELNSEFPRIKELFSAMNSADKISLTGLIRAVRDSEDDEWNFFIKQSELDKFKAEIPEGSEGSEKIESIAEDELDVRDENHDEAGDDSEDLIFDESA